MVLMMCHKPRRARAEPGTRCPASVPMESLWSSETWDRYKDRSFGHKYTKILEEDPIIKQEKEEKKVDGNNVF